MWRRKRKRHVSEDPGIEYQVVLILLSFAVVGLLFIWWGVWLGEKSVWGQIIGHIGGASMVSTLMGITYECLMDRRRRRQHDQQMKDIKDAVLQSISGLSQFSASKLLSLLQDVARSLDRTPTIFPPARSESECPFSSSPEYFDAIIQSARPDLIEYVGMWLRDSNENLRFLASDFVGKYEIREYAAEMRRAADDHWLYGQWKTKPEKTKQWVLNYYWALSSLEDNELQTLRGLLVTTQDEFTRKWILHVPLQMPGMNGVEGIVTDFMSRVARSGTDHGRMGITPDEAQAVIRAMAAIERHDRERGEAEGRGLALLRAHRKALAGYRSLAAKAFVGMNVPAREFPEAETEYSGKVVRREDDGITVEYGKDKLQAKVGVPPRPAVAPEDDHATVVGLTGANGAFKPLYAELGKGVLAPVLHVKP